MKEVYSTRGFGNGVELVVYCEDARAEDVLNNKGLLQALKFEVVRESNTSKIPVGSFYLAPMPGCCGIVVSTNSFLTEVSRHTAIGPYFHICKENVAKLLGYSVMISTTDMTNVAQVVSAAKAKWKFLNFFTNKRTRNKIGIAVKHI